MAEASREIRVPFRIGSDGDIDTITGDAQQIAQQIRMVVLTRYGERVMEPNFGSTLPDVVFEPLDPILMAEVGVRMEASLAQWVPEAHIHEVTPLYERMTEGVVQFNISFTVPPRQNVFSTLVTVDGNLTGISNG